MSSVVDSTDAVFCESAVSMHSDRGGHAGIAKRLGVTAAPVRMDSQCKYGAIARGDASIYLRLPSSATYREKIWDHAAGFIVVTEAGGTVTDAYGRELDFSLGRTLERNRGVVATNGLLHRKVLAAATTVLAAALADTGAADRRVVVFDKLTYAGSLRNLERVANDPRYTFAHGDIADREAVRTAFAEHRPSAVLNLAAESHVDRSIDGPGAFVRTNVLGTFELLEAARLDLGRRPKKGGSARTRPTTRVRPTRLPRRGRITWCAPGAAPTACRRS